MTVKSNDPLDVPNIDPAYFSNPFDLAALVQGVALVRQFANASAWNGFIVGPTGPFANATDTASLEKAIHQNAGTVFHSSSTASMSPKNAQWGVVNPDLTVKKTNGLRVVDASVMVSVPPPLLSSPPYPRDFFVDYSQTFFNSRIFLQHILKPLYTRLPNVLHH